MARLMGHPPVWPRRLALSCHLATTCGRCHYGGSHANHLWRWIRPSDGRDVVGQADQVQARGDAASPTGRMDVGRGASGVMSPWPENPPQAPIEARGRPDLTAPTGPCYAAAAT